MGQLSVASPNILIAVTVMTYGVIGFSPAKDVEYLVPKVAMTTVLTI